VNVAAVQQADQQRLRKIWAERGYNDGLDGHEARRSAIAELCKDLRDGYWKGYRAGRRERGA
jgi:hypothetical protein